MFPRIDSPCPLKSIQFPETGNFNCSTCKREVHNLSLMNEQQRRDFLLQCNDKICVSYSVKHQVKKAALAGLFVVTASGMALSVAAQTADELESEFYDVVLTGGVKNPKQQAIENSEDSAKEADEKKSLQLIPVVEEEENESGN
jgi:hypothetical protein